MMKSRIEISIYNVASFLLLIFTFTLLFFLSQFIRCFSASDAVPELADYSLIRICIFGSSTENGNSTVSARIAFLDSDNTEYAVIERSWSGSNLSMEFLCTSFGGKTICFPFRIYGSESTLAEKVSVKRGTKLYPYYIENGLCFLLGSSKSKKIKKSLYKLASYAFISQFQPVSNFTKKQVLNFGNLRTGEMYTIHTDFKGNLLIQHD